MIRFYCEHCAHKISVRDEDIGRQGKCSKCGKVVIVPTESTVIDFRCEYCDREISIPKSHAGKKVICPKCRNMFVIPAIHAPGSDANQDYSGDLIDRTTDSTHGLTLIDIPEEYKLKEEPLVQPSVYEHAIDRQQETESISQSMLPWFMNMFLYPISIPGLMHLGFFTIIPLLVSLIGRLLGPFSIAFALPSFLINIGITLYLAWYVTECVRDSAKGGRRAPEAFATAGLGEMWSQAQYIVGCYLIFFGPAFFYFYFSYKTDIVFWLLLGCGVFLFPMGLLSCVMFDSIRGLNPALLIPSIFSAFFQYCGLVLLITGIVLGFKAIPTIQTDNTQPETIIMILLGGFFSLILFYITFVVAHLLGLFYWRYEEKLNWEV